MITGMHVILTDGPILDRGWGLLTTLVLPGGERIGLYEPRHASPLSPARISENGTAT